MGGTFLPDSPNSLLERGHKQQVSSHAFLSWLPARQPQLCAQAWPQAAGGLSFLAKLGIGLLVAASLLRILAAEVDSQVNCFETSISSIGPQLSKHQSILLTEIGESCCLGPKLLPPMLQHLSSSGSGCKQSKGSAAAARSSSGLSTPQHVLLDILQPADDGATIVAPPRKSTPSPTACRRRRVVCGTKMAAVHSSISSVTKTSAGHLSTAGLCLLQARKNLELVRGTKDVDKEFDDLVEAARLANMCQHQWGRLFSWKYFPQLVLSACSTTFQQWTGINSEPGCSVRGTGSACLFSATAKHGLRLSDAEVILNQGGTLSVQFLLVPKDFCLA